MPSDFLQNHHVVAGLYPVADCFDGGTATDIISMENYRRATFIVCTGAVEDAAISNIVTVDSCDDVSASTTTAIAFTYRQCISSSTVDTWSAQTAATTSGYNFADHASMGVANAMWFVEVDAADLSGTDQFVRLAIAETANKTITAGVICILSEPRYPQGVPVQAIA